MYFSVPLFVFLHFTVAILMYRFLLAPAYSFKKLKSSTYIVFDRHKINGLKTEEAISIRPILTLIALLGELDRAYPSTLELFYP